MLENYNLSGYVRQAVKEVEEPGRRPDNYGSYTYYRLCESYREADGKVKQRTVLGLGELLDFPTEAKKKEIV